MCSDGHANDSSSQSSENYNFAYLLLVLDITFFLVQLISVCILLNWLQQKQRSIEPEKPNLRSFRFSRRHTHAHAIQAHFDVFGSENVLL